VLAPTPLQFPCPANAPPPTSHQYHPANAPTPTPSCKIPGDAQPMMPQCQHAAANAPVLPPIPLPTHYPKHPANVNERKQSGVSKASTADPPPPLTHFQTKNGSVVCAAAAGRRKWQCQDVSGSASVDVIGGGSGGGAGRGGGHWRLLCLACVRVGPLMRWLALCACGPWRR
jgi:hypothetical protein